MTVEAYTGDWSSGKTYMLAREGLAWMKGGGQVLATFRLDGAEYVWPDSERGLLRMVEFTLLCPGGMLLIDEAGIVFASRLWKEAPRLVLYLWAQGGKGGTEVRYSAHDLGAVDVTMRRVTVYEHRCRPYPRGAQGARAHGSRRAKPTPRDWRWWWPPGLFLSRTSTGEPPAFFRVTTFRAGSSTATDRAWRANRLSSRWVRFDAGIAGQYNTRELVLPPSFLAELPAELRRRIAGSYAVADEAA